MSCSFPRGRIEVPPSGGPLQCNIHYFGAITTPHIHHCHIKMVLLLHFDFGMAGTYPHATLEMGAQNRTGRAPVSRERVESLPLLGTSLADFGEGQSAAILAQQFAFVEVYTAFAGLEPDAMEIALLMCRYTFGVTLDAIDARLTPIEVKHGHGLGPHWIWRRFPDQRDSTIVSVHPTNGEPARIVDFAIPESSRPRMFTFESRARAI